MENNDRCKKVSFINEESAEFYINKIKTTSKRKKVPVRSYLCEKCCAWHLTSSIAEKKLRKEIKSLKKIIENLKKSNQELVMKVKKLKGNTSWNNKQDDFTEQAKRILQEKNKQ